jgi:hypothetical protein
MVSNVITSNTSPSSSSQHYISKFAKGSLKAGIDALKAGIYVIEWGEGRSLKELKRLSVNATLVTASTCAFGILPTLFCGVAPYMLAHQVKKFETERPFLKRLGLLVLVNYLSDPTLRPSLATAGRFVLMTSAVTLYSWREYQKKNEEAQKSSPIH